jgi:hypothetical protein
VRITDLTVAQRIMFGLFGAAILVALGVQAALSSHPAVAYTELASAAVVSIGFGLRRRMLRTARTRRVPSRDPSPR